MLAAVQDALDNLIVIIGDILKALFGYYTGNQLETKFRLTYLGTIILIIIAISVVFFTIRGIKKLTWGR